MQTSIEGLTAVVTGAGSGVGRACALRLAELGCNVVLVGRTPATLEETRSLSAHPEHLRVRPMDVADEAQVRSLAGELAAADGLDILMNNAGILVEKPFDQIGVQEFDEVMRVNARGVFLMCHELLGLLKKSPAATIINVASSAARSPYANQSVYAASKGAVLSLTKALAREVLPDGVRVHAISPGGIATGMLEQGARPDLAGQQLMVPEDIADMVEYLLTHRTGAVIDELVPRRVGKEPWPYYS